MMEPQELSPEERIEARKRRDQRLNGFVMPGCSCIGCDNQKEWQAASREELCALNTLDRLERDLAELLTTAQDYLDADVYSEQAKYDFLAEVVSRMKGRKV